jgi:adenylate kinase family enzyme
MQERARERRIRVAIVGPCASGKSTVAEQLRSWGFDAYPVGQEHSIVSDLWRRRAPDAVVYLEVDYQTVRSRRGEHWPEAIYQQQQARLADARRHATVIVDTGRAGISQTMARVLAALERVPPAAE